MLVIRLQRIGKKHQPSYRIAVAERRSKVGGPPTEHLGSYDPFTKKAFINKDRAAHWLKVGAHPSDTVWNLFAREGVVAGPARPVKMKKKKAPVSADSASVATSAKGAATAGEPAVA